MGKQIKTNLNSQYHQKKQKTKLKKQTLILHKNPPNPKKPLFTTIINPPNSSLPKTPNSKNNLTPKPKTQTLTQISNLLNPKYLSYKSQYPNNKYYPSTKIQLSKT